MRRALSAKKVRTHNNASLERCWDQLYLDFSHFFFPLFPSISPGTYSFDSETGRTCKSCPDAMTTEYVGAKDILECMCPVSSFGTFEGCQSCPEHSNTPAIGATSVNQCTCDLGYGSFYPATGCTICGAGYYGAYDGE